MTAPPRPAADIAARSNAAPTVRTSAAAAAEAFAELDAIDRHCSSNNLRVDDYEPRKERALRRLAWAMFIEFGPLHDPHPVVEVDAWRAE